MPLENLVMLGTHEGTYTPKHLMKPMLGTHEGTYTPQHLMPL